MVVLSTDMGDPRAVPYFLWDDPMTVEELQTRLASASEEERIRLLALVLREARDPDVWRFASPREVAGLWPQLAGRLGVRRPFWEFLLDAWRRQGLVADRP